MSNEVSTNVVPTKIVTSPSKLPYILTAILGLLLAGAAIVGFVLYYQTNALLKETQAELAKPISIDDIGSDAAGLGGSGLAHAAALLPHDANVKRVLFLQNGKYLIVTENVKTQTSVKLEMTIWLADTTESTLSKLAIRDIDDMASFVEFSSAVYPVEYRPLVMLKTIKFDEGIHQSVTDYFMRETGALRLTQSYDLFEEHIVLERGDKKLEIALAPKGACTNASEGAIVEVTGILVNGSLKPFASAKTVSCSASELYGRGFLPELSEASYSGYRDANGRDSAILVLPIEGIYVDIDVDSLEPNGVSMPM